jgi:hypothetical protein
VLLAKAHDLILNVSIHGMADYAGAYSKGFPATSV